MIRVLFKTHSVSSFLDDIVCDETKLTPLLLTEVDQIAQVDGHIRIYQDCTDWKSFNKYPTQVVETLLTDGLTNGFINFIDAEIHFAHM